MKRLTSLALVLCMLLAACFSLASCGKVTTKDVEKNAQAVLSEAMDNTTSEFFEDDLGIDDSVEAAMKGGAITIVFEGEEDEIGLDLSVMEVLYCDAKDKKVVSDTSVTYDGENIGALVFVDKNGVALRSSSILGSNKTLLLNPATLASGFEGSYLCDMLDPSDEELKQVLDVLDTINTEYQKLFDEDADENAEKKMNEIYALLGQTVAKEEVDDGKCVVVTYTVTNSSIKAVADKLVADLDFDDELETELKTELDDAIQEMNEAVNINITVKVCIGEKSNKVEKISLNGSVASLEDESESVAINADLTFAETEIKLTGSIEAPEFKGNADVTLSKETKGNEVIYKLVVNAGDGKGATINALNATYTYNKDNGAFVVAADIYSEGDDRITASLNGKISVEKNKSTIEINSVTAMDETINFKLSVSFEKNKTMPQLPDDAKDVVTLTESEWEEIITEIEENSKLAGLM